MGETQKIEITFDPEAFGAFMQQVAEAVRGTPHPAPPAQTPADLGLEQWAFRSPSAGCDVVAYVDDHNQVRHVPTTRTSEVPVRWRRVWLEDRR